MEKERKQPLNAKKTFKECGAGSHTFAHILNREFGHPKPLEELALSPLAGGIANQGQQCGMLWGTALAIGAEAHRRQKDQGRATALAVMTTHSIVESFQNQAKTVNCKEIIGIDLSTTFGLTKFILKTMVKGTNNNVCFNLADDWAPEAVMTARQGLADRPSMPYHRPVSCASIVAKKMGASDEEALMVAGFAGGLGLSGHACGALSATIWMKALEWCRQNPGKTPPFLNNKQVKGIVKAFLKKTDGEMKCYKITGQLFESIDDHTAFINEGGCKELIETLAAS